MGFLCFIYGMFVSLCKVMTDRGGNPYTYSPNTYQYYRLRTAGNPVSVIEEGVAELPKLERFHVC